MPSRVQGIAGQATVSNTLALTLPGAPTPGNLLVFVCYTPAAATQASASVPGFTQDVITDTGQNGSAVVLHRLVQAGDGVAHTLTWASASTSTVMGELIELAPGSGKVWATSGLVAATGGSVNASDTTGTVTATGATTGPTYAVAAVGLGGTSNFLNTWTGGFAWDGATVTSGRFRVAVKDSSSGETFSTAETWDTARASRMALVAYATQSPPATGTATGSWSYTGTAAGKRNPRGVAAGSWTFSGAAVGKRTPRGIAAGTWSYAGAAAGKRTPRGVATGSLSYTGSAVGYSPGWAGGQAWVGTDPWPGPHSSPAPPPFTVSAGLSGSGALISASQSPAFARAAALSGVGTLTATTRIAVVRTAALTGAGTLTAAAFITAVRVAALSGVGTLLTTSPIRIGAWDGVRWVPVATLVWTGTAWQDVLVTVTDD